MANPYDSPNHLDRPIMLHVCKDGTVTYRTRKEKVFNGVALPVFSVDTVEQAEHIQVRFCRLQYGRHPHPRGPAKWYTLTVFSGEIEDLDRVTTEFADFYAAHLVGKPKVKRAPARNATHGRRAGGVR